GVPILPDQLDRDPWLLNCANGTVELRTGRLREHRHGDYLTKLSPVPYDPNARAPQFDHFLHTIFGGNEPVIRYLQRLVGYALTGDVSEQILPIFWGSGANGKSTLLNALTDMLGTSYAIKAATDLLMVKRGDTHPTERADLFGKRLVLCIETEEGKRLAEALVKDLTGGDRIRARRMREDFWEFSPTHKVILCTNHRPRITGTDHAIWRRIRLIPFTVTIPDDNQDKRLPEKLRSELPGILAWAVQGCLAWQRDGLPTPEEVQVATKEYRDTQDLLGQFLDECCLAGNDNFRCKASALYTAYQSWCERGGEEPSKQRGFGESMTERGFKREQSNGTWYVGVALRDTSKNEG